MLERLYREKHKRRIKKKGAFLALFFFFLTLFPWPALARMAERPPVPEPFEKVVLKQGNWSTEYIDVAVGTQSTKLIVQYLGSRQPEKDPAGPPAIKLKLGAKTILKGIYLPTAYPAENKQIPPKVDIILTDSRGNVYGPFEANTYNYSEIQGKDEGVLLRMAPGKDDARYFFHENIFVPDPEEIIALPAETYTVKVSHPQALVCNESTGGKVAVLIKGVDYKAWQEYEKKVDKWEKEQKKKDKKQDQGEEADKQITLGDKKLLDLTEEKPDAKTVSKSASPPPSEKKGIALNLTKESKLEKLVLNTYNQGKGAIPENITILDVQNKVVAQIRPSGMSLNGVSNGAWVASPNVVLPPGNYTLKVPKPEALAYDEQGNPNFAIAATPAQPKIYYFTGLYRINVDVVKTSTIMGPVKENKSALDLKDFSLTVLDKGETLELAGKYQGMAFSQECKVTKREPNKAEALLEMSVDLKDLPYKAKVGARAIVTLENPGWGVHPSMTIKGTGTYERISKEKGNDFNTYSITGKGALWTRELPPFVLVALGNGIGSVGNVPGPDSPFTAAAGMLFPPLAALVAHVIQEAIRSKLSKDELLDIELAKKGIKKYSPAWYAAKYPGVSKETLAWIIMADALANSDEPDDDPFSVGDNEKAPAAGGKGDEYSSYAEDDDYEDKSYEEEKDYDTGYDSAGEGEKEASGSDGIEGSKPQEEPGLEQAETGLSAAAKTLDEEQKTLEAERDEWLKNYQESQKSADPNDPRAQELNKQYEDYIGYLNDRIKELEAAKEYASQPKMTVQVDHTGRTAEIAYDAKSGQWYNTETGNVFDVDRYNRDVKPNFEKDATFIEEQQKKLENRDTAFDRAMDNLVAENKVREKLLGQLQKWRNEAYGIEPPAEGVGDVKANIDKLINDLSNRDISVQDLADRAKKIGKVVTDRRTGATIGEDEGRNLADREGSLTSILANTAVESGIDVITGRTWAGMAGRAGLAMATGGVSEYILSPAEAMMDIKESIDAGESGVRATLKAMGKYALGELGGEYLSSAWKRSGYQINQELAEKLTKWGNTPVSEILGMGSKAGSKEGMEKVIAAKSKLLLESTGGKPYKLADDVADYAKYKAGVNNQASIIESKIRAGEPLSPDDIRKVLQDPSISRELKKSHPHIQNAYQDALEKNIYNPAKSNTASRLENEMLESVQKEFGPGAKVKIEVESIRTPGAKGSRINADNDLTGKITITDSSGKTITKELPAEKVAQIYNEEFAKASGMLKDGKFDVAKAKAEMPEGITVTGPDGKPSQIPWEQATREQQLEAFAKKHGQEVTDVRSAEAAVDFNAALNQSGTSNVAQLKSGVSTAKLVDPEGLAKMEQYKINNYFNKGGIANQTEAYEQLAKMGKLTQDLTQAYQKLGYNAADLPANMQKALDIVGNRNLSPATRTLELQKLGFDGPGDLANKLSGRIEGLQKLGNTAAGKTEDSVLQKVVAAIIRSNLSEKDN